MPNLKLGRWTKSAVMAAAIAVTGCQQKNETIAPFNPRGIQQPERAASVNIPVRPMRPLPTTLESPFPDQATTRSSPPPATGPAIGTEETIVRMPLRECIQRAVLHNEDIKVAGYDPAIDETRVTEAEARFDPTFFTNFQYGVDRIVAPTPDNPTVTTGSQTQFRTYTLATGVRQDLESGGKVELRWEPRYTHRYPDFDALSGSTNPFWTSDVTLQITQPLLRDFGADVNRARIVINRKNQQISVLEFRKAIEATLLDKNSRIGNAGNDQTGGVEDTYWQLVDAERGVAIAEELLRRTLDTGRILQERMTQDVGRVQFSQATSSIENRRTVLIRARANVRDLSDKLKKLMMDPEYPVAGNTLVLPSDKPIEDAISFNQEEQINTAMENRLELAEQQLRTENAATAAIVAKNNLLPQVNFVGNVGATALGVSAGNAIRDDFNSDAFEWAAGVQLEIPIGNRAARAIWKRAQLQRLQAITQYRAIVELVSVEVKTAIREVETSYTEMSGTRQARFAAADALAAVEDRENANEALTPEFVNRKLDLQQQLAEAARAEVQALTNYQLALAKLELAKGTILRYNNVIMEEAPLQNGEIEASK